MRKYWPVLLLAIISILGLSFYYINVVKTTMKNIDFQFETLEGDDKYLNDVILQASYSEESKYESYFVKKDSVEKVKNIFNNYYENNYEMLQLLKEHKNFFRAKQFTGRNYYNDDASLVYVSTNDDYNYENPNNVLYQIELLNKQDNEKEVFEIITSVEERHSWQTVEFVSYREQQLKAISIRTYPDNQEAVILTTFDLQQGTAQETVLLEPEKDTHVTTYNYQDTYNNNNQYVAFSQFKHDSSNDDDDDDEITVIDHHLYTVDILTNKLEDIPVEKDVDFQNYQANVFNEYITAYKEEDGIVNVLRYNMKTKQWLEDYNIEIALEMPKGRFQQYQLLDDKIYINYAVENGTAIEIVDFSSGEKLYAGLLTAQNMNNKHDLYVERVFHIQ